MKYLYLLFFIAFSFSSSGVNAQEKQLKTVNPLQIFKAYADKIWEADNGKTGKDKFHDISTWRWILGGKAIRISHQVNDGIYAGETHIFYDPTDKTIKMHYVTTDGFYTVGTAVKTKDGIHYTEKVKGQAGSITDVEAKSTITKDGLLQMSSRMKAAGQWSKWSTVTYKMKSNLQK